MAFYKAVIEETRRKVIFIEAPDQELAIGQYNAGVFGDLPREDNDKFVFTDLDNDVEYNNRLVHIEEADMEKEQEYADTFYEYYECVFWDEKQNCTTEGWYD